MTQIIGFAGKKQSGKNTACNFILATKIAELGVSRSSRLNNKGEIEITDILDDKISDEEWFSFESPKVDIKNLFDNELGNFIRLYAFADKLKKLCIDILGLKEELVFGTDEQKNTLTHMKWEDIPGEGNKFRSPESQDRTHMTVREVLQIVGTDIFRGLDSSIWVNACLRQIETDDPELALISDVRFENEVKAIQDKGGFVIGLKRDPSTESDKHASETQVEKCFDLCDTIIDNSELSIPQQNKQIYLAIKHLDNIPEVT